MKRISILLCLIYICFNSLFSQIPNGENDSGVMLPQGFIQESLTSRGNLKSTVPSIISLSSQNPALLAKFESNQLGFSYQFESKINSAWGNSYLLERSNLALPQSVNLIFAINNGLKLGLGFGQKFNSFIGTGELSVSGYNQNSLSYLHFYYNLSVMHLSLLSSYSFNNIFTVKDRIHLGLKVAQNILNYSQIAQSSHGQISIYAPKYEESAINWAIGILYESIVIGKQKVNFGFSYEYGEEIIEKELLYPRTAPFIIKLPDKLNTGFILNPDGRWKFVVESSYIFWEKVSNGWNNQPEISSSIIFDINKHVSSSLGFYYTDRTFIDEYYDDYSFPKNMDGYFFSIGLQSKMKEFLIDIVFTSSSLISPKPRKQTIFKFGIGYSLP